MGFFNRKSKDFNVFSSDGSVHPIHTSGDTSVDLSNGNMYFRSGNTVFGSDGSFMTTTGNGPNTTIFDSKGNVHNLFGSGNTKTMF